MNVVTNTWHQLVRRRLWPVALLLVAALVAVPVLLAAEPEPVVAPVESGLALGVDEGLAEPVVTKVAAEDRTRRRRVLGARKDPFRPAPVPKAKVAKKKKSTTVKPARTGPTTTTLTGGSGGGGFVSPTTPVVTKPKPKAYPAGSLIVRFGDATSDTLAKGLLKKLAPLPDEEAPLLVYMGLTKNGKKAIFLVDATATATGDGTCRPHPSTCETIELSKGETEFFDVLDPDTGEPTAQYQLDIVAIN